MLQLDEPTTAAFRAGADEDLTLLLQFRTPTLERVGLDVQRFVAAQPQEATQAKHGCETVAIGRFRDLAPSVELLGSRRFVRTLTPRSADTEFVVRQFGRVGDAFGATRSQRLFKVELPLALPTIMAGINQTIMMALAMVVIAAMIGVQGLGQPVLKAIANQYFTLGIFNGLAIVGIAVVFDRVSQAYGRRLQKHLEVLHG